MLADTGFLRQARMLLVLVVVSLPFGVAACGGEGDNAAGTVTVTTTVAGDGSTTDAADTGTVVNVELGESGSTYYVEPDQTTVEAGTVTFAVTNMGELYHEFIVYSNLDGVEPGGLPINAEEDEADLVEENIVGEAAYATPPIVPSDREPGDADHHIRGGGWGAEMTVDLEAGEYILLCNLAGHYGTYKQYAALTAE
jgi:uncharacterized cupredoxin-like copper-binding protein